MKVSDIDKQIVDIIDFMNEKEMKPFASCDGVLEEHEEKYREIYGENFDSLLKERPEMILCGYISFMENEYSKELLANALDNDLIVEFSTVSKDYEIYGNTVSGRIYTIRFLNLNGEKTELVNKVIRETCDGTMIPSKENFEFVQNIMNAIPSEPNKYKAILTLNSIKNFNTDKDDFGKHASIFIMKNDGYEIDGEEFAKWFSEEYDMQLYTNEDSKNEVEPERSYAYYRLDTKSRSSIILRDEYIERIPEMLEKMFAHEFTITKKEQ